MPEESLTPSEVAILITLLAEAREVANSELKELTGTTTITGKTRTKLVSLRLVDGRKVGREYAHTITKAGRDRCRQEISAGRPEQARGAAYGALYSVLAKVSRFTEREDLNLEYVFEGVGDLPPVPEAVAETPPVPANSPDVDLEERVRDAYKQLVSNPGGWVSLAELRPLLGDATKAAVDDVLKRMALRLDVSVIPEENQKTLTREQRAAAVRIGGKNNHLIAIEPA